MGVEILDEDSGEYRAPEVAAKPTRAGALPLGTVVTGINSRGLLGFVGHKDHLFELISDPKDAEFTNGGYQQEVLCLVDGARWLHSDGEFLQREASEEKLARCYDLVLDTITELKAAAKVLRGKVDGR